MQYSKSCNVTSTVRVFWMLVCILSLLLGIAGCSGDDEVQITSDSPLPAGMVAVAYSLTFQSDHGGQFWVLKSGALPPGLSLHTNGTLSGTPTTAGTFEFTVSVFQEVINEFFDPLWYDADLGFIGPVDPLLFDDASVGLESDSATFSLTIN